MHEPGIPLQLLTIGQPWNRVMPTQVLKLVIVMVEVPEAAGVNTKTSSSAVVYELLPQVTELVAVTSSAIPQVVLLVLE